MRLIAAFRQAGFRPRVRFTALVMVSMLPIASAAKADDADKILKSMSDYIQSQQGLSLTFDSDIEVITPEIQKIQFASSGTVALARPDKIRASRTGGYTDVELVFDGKSLSVVGKNLNVYAQAEAPGTIDELIARLRDEHSLDLPGADLLVSNPYEVLSKDVLDAKHIGRGVVDGVECEHLAFRNQDTDWQLWVEAGERPIPRKLVITSKDLAAAPQYTLVIRDWKTGAPGADTFTFQPPDGAKEVNVQALSEIDEVPPGIAMGANQ